MFIISLSLSPCLVINLSNTVCSLRSVLLLSLIKNISCECQIFQAIIPSPMFQKLPYDRFCIYMSIFKCRHILDFLWQSVSGFVLFAILFNIQSYLKFLYICHENIYVNTERWCFQFGDIFKMSWPTRITRQMNNASRHCIQNKQAKVIHFVFLSMKKKTVKSDTSWKIKEKKIRRALYILNCIMAFIWTFSASVPGMHWYLFEKQWCKTKKTLYIFILHMLP